MLIWCILSSFFILIFEATAYSHMPFSEQYQDRALTIEEHESFSNLSTYIKRSEDVAEASATPINSDPNLIPTLFYACGVFEDVCKNIIDRLSSSSNQGQNRYTTTLHYAPDPKETQDRRNKACGSGELSFTNRCKAYYSCDTTRPKDLWRDTCDEFPFASSQEGGSGSNLRCVGIYEQRKQGAFQMVVGQAAGILINGQIIKWKDQTVKDPNFKPAYRLVVEADNKDLYSLGRYEVTQSGDHSVYTSIKMAAGILPHTSTYNYDMATFRVEGRITKCSCPTSAAKDCDTCIHTKRPPFGPGFAPDTLNAKKKREQFPFPIATPIPESVRSDSDSTTTKRKIVIAVGSHEPTKTLPPTVAGLMAKLKLEINAPSLIKRQQNSCPTESPDPQDVAAADAESSDDASTAASQEADALAETITSKSAVVAAAAQAVAAATAALNFLNAFVSAATVSSAVLAALAAARALDRTNSDIDSIYSKIVSAADEASSVISVASANPTIFTNTCTENICTPVSTGDDGPTYIPPPVTTSSTTITTTTSGGGGSQPTGPPGSNGCIVDNSSRIWGARIKEARPSYSCNEDYTMKVEPIEGSKRIRLSTVLNGNKGYLSWTPEKGSCGEVNWIQLIPTSYDTALTMEWVIDECGSDGGARISPYWNGSPFPNFAIDLLNLLPVGSPDESALRCYENSISVKHYDDNYFTLLPAGASDPAKICSTAYPQSSSQARQAAQPHGQASAKPTSTDSLLQQASAWPTRLMRAAPARKLK